MRLSIVIPTHNRPVYLARCLEALERELRGRNDIEAIVVDDGSPDRAAQENHRLCEVHGAEHHLLSRNHGMAVGRDEGSRRARGEWIAFIDDDIVVEEGWLTHLLEHLAAEGPKTVGIEGCVLPSGRGVWDREVQNPHGGTYLTCHMVYRRDVLLEAGGFDRHFEFEGPFHEDHELASRMLQRGAIPFDPALRATHLPRTVRPLRHIWSAPRRMRQVLNAELYFYSRQREAYHRFRHARTFWGTYGAIATRHIYTALHRRERAVLAARPLETLALITSSALEQFAALLLFPHLLSRYRREVPANGVRARLARGAGMRVWFAGDVAREGGGVARSMRELAAGLSRLGHETRVVTRDDIGGGNYLGFALKLALMLLRNATNPPDWVVARSTDGFGCAALSRLLGMPTRVVLHNHGWEVLAYGIERGLPSRLVTSPTTWKAKVVRFSLLRATFRLADLCLSGTIWETRRLKAHVRQSLGKAVYVGNGVEPAGDAPWVEVAMPPPVFLAVGGPTWKKGLDHTVALFGELAARVPDARLHVVGAGEGALPAVAARANIETVAVEGFAHMDNWYRRCPYLIVSSRYEGGHSLAALEAMAHGAVVFATPIPSTLEFIRDGGNGVLIGGSDAAADARVVREILDDPSSARSLRRCAVATARRNRWERQVKRLEGLLCRGS